VNGIGNVFDILGVEASHAYTTIFQQVDVELLDQTLTLTLYK